MHGSARVVPVQTDVAACRRMADPGLLRASGDHHRWDPRHRARASPLSSSPAVPRCASPHASPTSSTPPSRELDPDGTGRAIASRGSADDTEHQQATVDATMTAFGRVDYIVNNAAVNPYFGPMMDYDLAAVRKIFEVNVIAALSWTQLVWKRVAKGQRWRGAQRRVDRRPAGRAVPRRLQREQGRPDPHDETARPGARARASASTASHLRS